jgi:hypothetical protein
MRSCDSGGPNKDEVIEAMDPKRRLGKILTVCKANANLHGVFAKKASVELVIPSSIPLLSPLWVQGSLRMTFWIT